MDRDVFKLIGTTLDGKYRVDAVIGEGGFGVVYRGFHTTFEHPIAVKCLKIPAHFTREAQQLFFERFREEGKLLSKLSSASFAVVRVFDFGVATGESGARVPYLVLEWLEGESLEELLAARRSAGTPPFPEEEAVALLRPAIDALATAHAMGIAHRDVKPANIFVVRASAHAPSAVKVLDFGIAKAMHEGETATRLQTRTTSGFSAFSPQYGAPEQFYAKKFGATGPWTDVHALGLCLVEMVSGKAPLDGEETAEWLEASTSAERPTPLARGAHVSEAFDAVCARALARMPKERFASAREFGRALDDSVVVRANGEAGAPPDSRSESPAPHATEPSPVAATPSATVVATPAAAAVAPYDPTELAERTELAEPQRASERREPTGGDTEADDATHAGADADEPARGVVGAASAEKHDHVFGIVPTALALAGGATACVALWLPWIKRIARGGEIYRYGPSEHLSDTDWDQSWGLVTNGALWVVTALALWLTVAAARRADGRGSSAALGAIVAAWIGCAVFAKLSGHWWGPVVEPMPGIFTFLAAAVLLTGSAALARARTLSVPGQRVLPPLAVLAVAGASAILLLTLRARA